MKNIVLSDIHIGSYKTYNPTPDFRLKQFLKLGNVISNLADKKSIDEIWIAGDLLQTAQSTPQVMAVVKTFLMTISKNNVVRLVLGNHDVIVRSDKTSINEYNNYTLISLLDSLKNVFIYNDDVISINNKTIHFHSWVPSNVFEYKDADYLVCHGDFDKTISPFASSFIDTSKYKRVFCGHIHIFKEIRNGISLGTPLMHSFSDSPDVGILIYDFDNDTYERVSTKGLFLEFKYAENEKEALELDHERIATNADAVIRIKPEKTDIIDAKTLTSLSIDPKNALQEFTKDISENSKQIINNIISKSNENESDVPDLRVKLLSVKANNFLSIKNIEFNFENYEGLTTIRGHVGAGKTTLFNLIEFMFFGKLYGYNKADYTSVYPGKFSGVLELEYKGLRYVIKRTLSSLEYTKDSKAQESNKKNDLQKCLENDLSFLRFWNLIYIKQSSTGIFSDMSDTSKVSFLSNLIGLNTIKVWTELLAADIKGLSNDNIELNKKSVEYTTKISLLNMFNEQNKEHSTFIDDKDVNDEIEKNNNNINSINNIIKLNNDFIIKLNNDKSNKENLIINNERICNKINSYIDNILKTSDEIKRLNNEIENSNVEQPIMPVFNVEIPKPGDMTSYDNKIKQIDEFIQKDKVSLGLLNSKLNDLQNHPDICPTCKQKWHIENLDEKIKMVNDKINEFNSRIESYESEKSKIFDEKTKISNEFVESYKAYEEKKKQYDADMKEYSKKNAEYLRINNLKLDVSHLQNDIVNNKSEIDTLKSNFQECSYIFEGKHLVLHNNILKNQIKDIDNDIKNKTDENENHSKFIASLNVVINELIAKKSEIKHNNEIYENIQRNIKEIHELESKNTEILEKVKTTEDTINELSKFNSRVLSDKGLLVASLLQKVADYLNNDSELKVETIEQLQNGNLKPTLNIKLFVKEYGKYVDYGMLSGGQRLLADLRFLKGITNTIGSISVIFMDETFKFFSTDTVFEGVEIIKDMNVDKVFLILHGADNETFNDKTITVTLTEDGSKYM